jgi:hypothetical protein
LGHNGSLARLKLGISIWITAILSECSCKFHAHKKTRAFGVSRKPPVLQGLAVAAFASFALKNQMIASAGRRLKGLKGKGIFY